MGLYTLRGTISGDRLIYEGEELLEKIPSASTWCVPSGNLRYRISMNGSQILSGTWGPDYDIPNGCPAGSGGEFHLKKS